MNTPKIKLTTLSLALVILTFTQESYASGNDHMNVYDSHYFEEYFEYEEMNEMLDLQLKPEVNIKIFNSNNEMIASGNENGDKIKNCISKSDFLTEIDGTKYYRFSYK
jgi:hypothetical protein